MLLCIIGIRWIPSPGGAWCNAPTGIEFAAMKPSERKIEGERIAELLHRCRVARQALLSEGQLTPGFALLARWQSRRLAWTHRDLKASRRFGPAVDFFLGDLYGDRDYTPRDEGMERVAGVMVRLMPLNALRTIAMGIEIHAMTQELDRRMVEVMSGDLGVSDRLDAALYAEAYRRCDNAAARERQILQISAIGRALDEVVHHTVVYNSVRLFRRPAHMMGFGALHDFIERGFIAFRHLDGADEFLDTIERRELRIMRSILDEAPVGEWAPPEDAVTLQSA